MGIRRRLHAMRQSFRHTLRFIFSALALLLWTGSAFATHNRAGEICYKHISGTTFEFTLITYTDPSSPAHAARDSLTMVFDANDPANTSVRVPRVLEIEIVDGEISRNEYKTTWTFPGPGLCYTVYMEDPNRVAGVCNMADGASVNVPFYLETVVCIQNPTLVGYNNSADLLYPPIDNAVVGVPFEHNPNAFDPDGDSLVFRLAPSYEGFRDTVPGFEFPQDFDNRTIPGCGSTITIDQQTGQLTWDAPCQECIYNFGIIIEEWRGGLLMGSKLRDLQVFVLDNDNNPPEIAAVEDTCIIAGETLLLDVTATDPDGDNVELSATGGPFAVTESPATFPTVSGGSTVTQLFEWNTVCSHVRDNVYQVVFRASDDFRIGPLDAPLTDLKSLLITVVAPPPENLTATPIGNRVELRWDSLYTCFNTPNFQGFTIWRKVGCDSGFVFDVCQRGLGGTDYERIGGTLGAHRFTDFDVVRGPVYSYRVVAEFAESPAGSPALFNEIGSRPSDATCVELRQDLPVMTNVSVEVTDAASGEIFVAWVPPSANDLDTVLNPGPYRFELLRSEGFGLGTTDPVTSFSSPSFAGLTDSSFTDTGLNTVDGPFTYTIDFFASDALGAETNVGQATPASSIFLDIVPADNRLALSCNFNVPWTNTRYRIFRETPTGSGVFTFLDSTNVPAYLDDSLANGREYCYYVEALGSYGSPSLPDSLINLSQIACAIPEDLEPSCPPVLSVANVCTEGEASFDPNDLVNALQWSNPNLTCADDVLAYNVYFAPSPEAPLEILVSLTGENDTTFLHEDLNSLAGCYAVTALDSVGNESAPSEVICVDNCPEFILPNTFTPNGDGFNDVFRPRPPLLFIAEIDIKIFDRYGGLVFETNDPAINWDGRNRNGQEVAEGVYYYVCNVVEERVDGEVPRSEPLEGFIHVIRGNGEQGP
jgi:gliding motility-associated-like protein